MIFEEKTLRSERIYEGRILNLRKDTVTVRTGESEREIVEHCGGAVVLALTDEGKLVTVEQYRKPVERAVLEMPAGKIDPGEDPEATALRELREETGYRAGEITFLTKIYPSVGYSEEVLYLYLCRRLTPGETDFDENEAITVREYEPEELYRGVMEGRITDAKTQVAVLFAKGLDAEGRLRGDWKAKG